jgi:hypothetical protein
MQDKISILCKESGLISELSLVEDEGKRIFTLSKKLGWEKNGEERISIELKNPNNFVEIKDNEGNSLKMSFETLVSLKEAIDHFNDLKNVNVFGPTLSIK